MRFFCSKAQNCAQTVSPSAFGDCFAEREFPYKKNTKRFWAFFGAPK